jgi:hypothetical protein
MKAMDDDDDDDDDGVSNLAFISGSAAEVGSGGVVSDLDVKIRRAKPISIAMFTGASMALRRMVSQRHGKFSKGKSQFVVGVAASPFGVAAVRIGECVRRRSRLPGAQLEVAENGEQHRHRQHDCIIALDIDGDVYRFSWQMMGFSRAPWSSNNGGG